jgi:hypothetical protein
MASCEALMVLGSSGWGDIENVFHSLSGWNDGGCRCTKLMIDFSRVLHGTTSEGEATDCASGCDAVFETYTFSDAQTDRSDRVDTDDAWTDC